MRARGTLQFSIFALMKPDYRKQVFLLMAFSLVIRGIVAAVTELGNDEVYYWTYALFPDWSHFDHPPMLGWVIRFFTLDLMWDGAFALRLPALILGTLNIWIIYRIGILTGNPRTGWYAALLYTGSVYASVLAGTFILPDTPLGTFYLAALFYFLKACGPKNGHTSAARPVHFLTAGVFAGLAMLSKYTGVFLWAGILPYLLLFRRNTFKTPWLWAGMGISLLLFFPVILWNLAQAQSSFSFHSQRIIFFGEGLKLFYFGREVLGLFFYHNPINVGLMVWSVFYLGKHLHKARRPDTPLSGETYRMLLLQSVPLISGFLFISLFRETLPHWSAPGFYPLMLLAAAAADHRRQCRSVAASPALLALIVVLGVVQIQTGLIPLSPSLGEQTTETTDGRDPMEDLGRNDFTLDMYGWKQLGSHFSLLVQEQEALYLQSGGKEGMPPQSAILSTRWFPAAHLDYYVARPNRTVVKTIGPVERTHKYEQITKERGGIAPGEMLYYIESSRFPEKMPQTAPLDTFFVHRSKRPVIRYIIHRITADIPSSTE